MDVSKKLLLTGIELLQKGASDLELSGRLKRLAGHAIFALGRAGSGKLVDLDLHKKWLQASGEMERDGLSQTLLRDKVIELQHTQAKYFNSIFYGTSSLLLHKAANEFFRELRSKSKERERTVCLSLGLAFLLLAEDKYSVETRSLQEYLEQKSAVRQVTGSSQDLVTFLALTADFVEIFGRIKNSSESTGIFDNHQEPEIGETSG